MNDQEFQRRVRQHLNMSTHTLPTTTTSRLHAARQKALAAQRAPVRALSLAGIGRHVSDALLPNSRIAGAMLAALLSRDSEACRRLVVAHFDNGLAATQTGS